MLQGHNWEKTGLSLRYISKRDGLGACLECRGIIHPGVRSLPAEERFWAYVKKLPGENACWEWQKFKGPKGYGVFGTGGCGKTELAHRYGYRLQNGDFPEDLQVLHKCDNPSCVRGDHLFVGTHMDNMNDRDSKGRQPRGSRAGAAILTEDQVRGIRFKREYYKTPLKTLAQEYGVAPTTISGITNYRKWKHVP